MPDPRVRKSDTYLMVEEYRRLIDEDPERWGDLRMLVEQYPAEYDPEEPNPDDADA